MKQNTFLITDVVRNLVKILKPLEAVRKEIKRLKRPQGWRRGS